MKTLIFALVITTGCAGVSTMNQDFVMSGSAEGIRAYNDGIIGMAKTAKEKDAAHNQYMASRATEEREHTVRQLSHDHAPKSFLEKLLSSDMTDENTMKPQS